MFVLTAHITIGEYSFTSVNDIRIRKGIQSYVDTCVLKVPTSARLKQSTQTTETVEVAKKFSRGDKVTVKLGYNGKLKTEFVGFVSRINFTTPCEIECEGYSYQLRKNNIHKTFDKGTSLRSLCEALILNTDIKLSNSIPQVNLGTAMRVVNSNGAKVLDHIKSDLKFVAYFNGDQLYVGLEETEAKSTVKYQIGFNTYRDGGLKYHSADETRVKVVMKTANSEGGKDIYTCGDPDGEVHEHIVKLADQKDIKRIAEGYLSRLKFSGFEGSISGFLEPYCEPGDGAQIIDPKYQERNGTYFVPSIEVLYGTNGARRIVELSKKISA